MILMLHILIALASLAYAGYVFFRPSHSGLKVTYSLVGLTLASGTYLVWSQPAHMVQACISGLVYIAVVLFATALAQSKLAGAKQD